MCLKEISINSCWVRTFSLVALFWWNEFPVQIQPFFNPEVFSETCMNYPYVDIVSEKSSWSRPEAHLGKHSISHSGPTQGRTAYHSSLLPWLPSNWHSEAYYPWTGNKHIVIMTTSRITDRPVLHEFVQSSFKAIQASGFDRITMKPHCMAMNFTDCDLCSITFVYSKSHSFSLNEPGSSIGREWDNCLPTSCVFPCIVPN